MENLSIFIWHVYQAPSLVWTLALLMSAVSGYVLHSYIGDYLYATVSACVLFVAILIAHVAFTDLGVLFTTNKDSNIAASAGIAICYVTLIALILLRLWHAVRFAHADLRD
jgi:hypothetical protein